MHTDGKGGSGTGPEWKGGDYGVQRVERYCAGTGQGTGVLVFRKNQKSGYFLRNLL